MPIRKIENPEQFRSNIREKLGEFFETKDAVNLEKGIHNWTIKEATNKKVIKKWDNQFLWSNRSFFHMIPSISTKSVGWIAPIVMNIKVC